MCCCYCVDYIKRFALLLAIVPGTLKTARAQHLRYDTLPVAHIACKVPSKIIIERDRFVPLSATFNMPQPFMTVHGDVQYDFMYRSLVDTPFAQKDFTQHTIQANLDFLFAGKYPFHITISNRRSNSPYFDNITDVNFRFNQAAFINALKNNLKRQIPQLVSKYSIRELEDLYNKKKKEVMLLQGWLHKQDRLQEIIEAKEAALRRKTGDTLNSPAGVHIADSLPAADMLAGLSQKAAALDKALAELKEYETTLNNAKGSLGNATKNISQELARIADPAQLKDFIRKYNLDTRGLPQGWKMLSSINNIGIGRTWVDYSELTVKNISLTGINAEINPSKLYLAVAAGKVNYRFRDFVVKDDNQPKQSLYLVRAGIGKKEGNNFIATWYDGKKALINYSGLPVTGSRLERVIGFSLQSRLQLDENHYIILESAKSSFRNTSPQPVSGTIKNVWNFNDRSNEAYSIRAYNNWQKTNTKLGGYYRKMGEHFQSFTLQPINVDQEAYQLSLQQSLWKRRLTVDAGIRKNDFSNPLINPGISSKTVFKSLLLALRVPKYPFVSIGYYPSSQLTVLNNNVIAENQYNTLSMIVSHAYRAKRTSMSSSLVLLKFYNNSADTGFIYYNASSLSANHFIFLKNLQLQSGLTITSQQQLKVFTLEQSVSLQASKWLSLNGGLKHNRVNGESTMWGGTAGVGLYIKPLGTIQAAYDKSYLPGTSKNLLPVDMGRITYYRTF